jgi:SAM-dependent methyltransferase
MKQKIVNLAKKYISHNFRIFLRKINWNFQYFIQSILSSNKNSVYCPIDEKEYKTFIKIKGDLASPGNGARKRHRLIWLFLKNELGILEKKATVLHIGPEQAFFNILKNQNNLNYIPGDKMVDGYNNQKGIRYTDLTNLDFDSNYFDYIICNHVLEHIPDDSAAISEMYRTLKNKGKAIITVPLSEENKITFEDKNITSASDREKYYGQWDHLRLYGTDIKDKFVKAGFKCSLVKYADNFSDADKYKYGISNDIIIFAEKP